MTRRASNFDAKSKIAKIPNSLYVGGGIQLPMTGVKLPTFDAKSKSAKIPNSLHGGGGGARG